MGGRIRRCPTRARVQAQTLAGLLVEHVFVSPLQRAQQTATHIAGERTTLDDLAELYFGEWEGLTWEEIEARDPELAARKIADWFCEPAPGGETLDELLGRARRALARVKGSGFFSSGGGGACGDERGDPFAVDRGRRGGVSAAVCRGSGVRDIIEGE